MLNYLILPTLLISLVIGDVSTTIQILREKEGDSVPGFKCEGGTLMFRDDATHSLYCAKSLEQAGCKLRFLDSKDVKCVEKTGSNEYFVVPLQGNTFCGDGYNIAANTILLQNYPDNLRASVWFEGQGVERVKNSIKYLTMDNAKIKLRVLEYWAGFVIKLNFECKNGTGHKDTLPKYQDYCVILKNVGHTPYPLEKHTFISAAILTEGPTTNPDKNGGGNGNNNNSNNNETISNYPLIFPTVTNEEMMFAIIVAMGGAFIIISICSTIIFTLHLRKNKRPLKSGHGNEGFTREDEEGIEEIDIENIVVVADKQRGREDEGMADMRKCKEELPTKRFHSAYKKTTQEKSKAFWFKRAKDRKLTSPPPQTQEDFRSRLQFSPIISTDSKRISNSQPNLINAMFDSDRTTQDIGSSQKEKSDGLTALEERVIDQNIDFGSPEILRQFSTNEINDFNSDTDFYYRNSDPQHVYAKVTPRFKRIETSRTSSTFTSTNQDLEETLNSDERAIEDMYTRVFNSNKYTPMTRRQRSETLQTDVNNEEDSDSVYEQVPELSPVQNQHEIVTDQGNVSSYTYSYNGSPTKSVNDDDESEKSPKSAMSFWKNRTNSNTDNQRTKQQSPSKPSWQRGNFPRNKNASKAISRSKYSRAKSLANNWQQQQTEADSRSFTKTESVRRSWRNRSDSDLKEQNFDDKIKNSKPISTDNMANEKYASTFGQSENPDTSAEIEGVNMSESIEAMFDLDDTEDDVKNEGKVYDNFAEILRKQMMY